MISFELQYNKKGCPSIAPFVESVELVDVASGKASTLSVTLCDTDGRFSGTWQATKGDSIAVKIPPAGAVSFAIKKITYTARPRLVTWVAEARPSVSKAPSGRGSGSPPPNEGAVVSDKKSWDDGPLVGLTLRAIAQRVCAECGLSLKYCVKGDPVISHCARYNETGFHLIDRLARRFGYAVRASAGALSIVGAKRSEDAAPPASMKFPVDRILSMGKAEVVPPASVASARLDPRSGEDVKFSAGDGDGGVDFLDFDVEIPSAVYDAAAASSMAADLAIVPTAGVVAGSILDIDGLGLREVVEMKYTRTGDAETMTLKTRASK